MKKLFTIISVFIVLMSFGQDYKVFPFDVEMSRFLKVDSTVYLSGIDSTVGTNVLYYNDSTGAVSYGESYALDSLHRITTFADTTYNKTLGNIILLEADTTLYFFNGNMWKPLF